MITADQIATDSIPDPILEVEFDMSDAINGNIDEIYNAADTEQLAGKTASYDLLLTDPDGKPQFSERGTVRFEGFYTR